MSNIACKYCQTEREHDYDFAECCDGGHIEALEAERDELKAGRASFFDVHAKMQDRLSDAEADNDKLRKTLREAVPVMENSGSSYTEGSTHDIAWDDARDSCVAKAREQARKDSAELDDLCATERYLDD